MQVIAHRGFSSHFSQNTLKAFEQALLCNVHAIELDIHQVENEFVVFHDFNLQKLTGKPGRIDHISLRELAQCRVMERDKIPLLCEVLALVGEKALVNIEIKSLISASDFCDYLIPLIEKHKNKIALSSFNHPLLKECQAKLSSVKGIKYGALIAHLPLNYATYANDMTVDVAAIDCESVNQTFVDDAHNKGLAVWSYTVNDLATLKQLHSMGVDAIFTDNPKWALEEIILLN